MRLILPLVLLLAAGAAAAQRGMVLEAVAKDQPSYRNVPYDPDRPPGQLLYGNLSPRLDAGVILETARNAFIVRNWQIMADTSEGFDAQFSSRDIEAKLHVFVIGSELRYLDDSTIHNGAQRAMAPGKWMATLRRDLRSAFASVNVRAESQPAAGVARPQAAARDPVQRLRELKSLLDSGLITQAEYEAKRAQILKDL